MNIFLLAITWLISIHSLKKLLSTGISLSTTSLQSSSHLPSILYLSTIVEYTYSSKEIHTWMTCHDKLFHATQVECGNRCGELFT